MTVINPTTRRLARLVGMFAGFFSLLLAVQTSAAPSVPVTVVNPSSRPALASSVDDPGRIAYQSTNDKTGICSGSSCVFQFGPVPAGHRLVAQHISGVADLNTTGQELSVFVALQSAGTESVSAFQLSFASNSPSSSFDRLR